VAFQDKSTLHFAKIPSGSHSRRFPLPETSSFQRSCTPFPIRPRGLVSRKGQDISGNPLPRVWCRLSRSEACDRSILDDRCWFRRDIVDLVFRWYSCCLGCGLKCMGNVIDGCEFGNMRCDIGRHFHGSDKASPF
jgi:hypothetical protein